MRLEARNFERNVRREINPDKTAWISIMEPDEEHISSDILEKCSKIKLKFWDIIKPREYPKHSGKTIYPVSDKIINQLYKFLLENIGKDIYVNCAAGVSRSGAICQFLEDMFGYKWCETTKRRAVPNSFIYKKLVDAFINDGKLPPTKIIDKRRIKE